MTFRGDAGDIGVGTLQLTPWGCRRAIEGGQFFLGGAVSLASATRVVPYAKAIAFALAACVVCSLLGFGAGVWAGIEWQQGRQAQVENKDLKADVEGLLQAAVDLRQRGVDIAQDFRTAHRRMEAISDDHEQRNAALRQFFDQQQDALGDLVAANPGLRDGCLGDAGVQHWNAAARRSGAIVTPAGFWNVAAV